MIFINMSMIDWLTKKQATVKGAVFGAEFVAMKHGTWRPSTSWHPLQVAHDGHPCRWTYLHLWGQHVCH
ncbi:hypothetical protein ACHAXR_002729 [Thalassiosira sp. AJA248-18]